MVRPGTKDDRFDAYVLADTIRTDRRRLTALRPDTGDTVAVRARADLVAHRVALSNQLRAHLSNVLPAAIGLFSELTSQISRAFLAAYPTQEAVDTALATRNGQPLVAWLAGQRHRKIGPGVLLARLRQAPAGITGPAATALATVTHAYLTALNSLIEQITVLEAQIGDALDQHPDGPIFTSLPRSGTVRAARLLAEIGDARGRFPNAASLADSRHDNPWAAQLYAQARTRGNRHPHAVRILARAWLGIIWKCWTTSTPYDPQQHRKLQTLLQNNQPTPA